ncbi:unnamed protein product [Symbiodinium pilosum]|uniref:UBA domain-containing protein n=1 Tax=Symbiodinium pilosum TaxID=2952 RepID=A0A812MYI0_SYMPI|nr:unnamed protein product [Symbiodinium pilosum]
MLSQAAAGEAANIATLVAMGFSENSAIEAFKRCSTVEAAAAWIVEQTPN